MREGRKRRFMVENQRKSRKKSKHSLSIVMTFVLMALILGMTAWTLMPEEQPKKNKNNPTEAPKIEIENIVTEQEVLAVVLEKDTELKMITVYNVITEEEQKLIYTGATTFFNGYGVQMSAGQLLEGDLYQFMIDTKEEWISTAKEAIDRTEKKEKDGIWEKTGIAYFTVEEDKISFRNQNYRYSKELCVMSNGKKIPLENIEPNVDIVTVRGLDQTIYEIVVTKGHGYISLNNHEDFVGGTISIGNTRIESIEAESKYLVREGSYRVAVNRGEYSGMEELVVKRDETTVFDVFAYGSGPIEKGWLTIAVEPLGATLYIDDIKTAYTDGIELNYGTYHFEFTEGGYVSYEATVQISQPRQSLFVYLTEQTGEILDENDPTNDPQTNLNEEDDPTEDPDTSNTEEENNQNNESSAVQTSVSIRHLGYDFNEDDAIYILGPEGSEIYLDGEYLGQAPMDFEKILGSYVITVIKSDGSVKNFNCSETDNGEDSYYNFSWTD